MRANLLLIPIAKLTQPYMDSKYLRLLVFIAIFTHAPFSFAINLAVGPSNKEEVAHSNNVDIASDEAPAPSTDPLIEVGDVLLYRVIEDRDDQVALSVMDSGEVYIPYYGPVQAVGKTPTELAQNVKELLEKDLYEKATVLLSLQMASPSSFSGTVFLSGKINRIGPIQIDPAKDNTVAKLILSAGGFSDFADSSHVRIVRRNTSTRELETIVVDVAAVIEDGKLDEDVKIFDGDFIIIPKKLINW